MSAVAVPSAQSFVVRDGTPYDRMDAPSPAPEKPKKIMVGRLAEGINPRALPDVPQPDPTLFGYSDLAPEVAALARKAAHSIRERQKASIVEIGTALAEVKAALPHGQWLPWLTAEFDMTDKTASNYVHAARFLQGKSEIVSNLPPATLYALAAPSADQEIVGQVVTELDCGTALTPETIKDRLARATKARQAAAAVPSVRDKEAEKRRRAAKARADKKFAEEHAAREANQEAAAIGSLRILAKLGAEDLAALIPLMTEAGWARVLRLIDPSGVWRPIVPRTTEEIGQRLAEIEGCAP